MKAFRNSPKGSAAILCLAAACPFAASAAEAQAPAADSSGIAKRPQKVAPTANDLNEVIVTARRRPEPLQRTPISLVAFSSKELESRSVTNLRTLQYFVPNLTFAPSQNVGEAAANVFIRGIGQEDFGIAAEGGVGFYVDGVYFSRSLGLLMNLVDVQRIEVLRGPQGTLYGKDTIGGAINVLSTMPAPGRERKASMIAGNYDRAELRMVFNEPVSDRLFMRFSSSLVSRDGYLRRLRPPASLDALQRSNAAAVDLRPEGAEHSLGGRLQLRWLATDRLTVDVALDATRVRNTQGANHVDLIDPGSGDFPQINDLIRHGKLPGPQITPDFAPTNLLESYAGGENFVRQQLWGGSTTISREFGGAKLKFIGAYRALRSHVGTDDDGLYFDLVGSDLMVRQNQLSGELQLTGEAGRLAYTAGLFALEEKGAILPSSAIIDTLFMCGCSGSDDTATVETRRLRTASTAGYAQGTYALTRGLSATLGARYTHERKSLRGTAYGLDSPVAPSSSPLATGSAHDRWNAFTYRGDLTLQATPSLMTYVSIARGFKSGGFNVRSNLDLPNMGFTPFAPETALTYELGLRSEWLHRKLRFNATVFDTRYRDIQLRQQTIVDGVVATLIENAARANISGVEAELAASPFHGVTVGAAIGHLNARYVDVGRVLGLTLSSKFQRSPRDTFALWTDYNLTLPYGQLELHGDFSFRSSEQFQILPALNDQRAYGLLGARVTYRAPDHRWSIALFGTNLADKRYRTAGRGTLIHQAGFAYSSIGMPLQLGVQFSRSF